MQDSSVLSNINKNNEQQVDSNEEGSDVHFGFMIKNKQLKKNQDIWLLDSGASINVINSTNNQVKMYEKNASIESISGDMNVNLMIEHRLFGECLYIPSSK